MTNSKYNIIQCHSRRHVYIVNIMYYAIYIIWDAIRTRKTSIKGLNKSAFLIHLKGHKQSCHHQRCIWLHLDIGLMLCNGFVWSNVLKCKNFIKIKLFCPIFHKILSMLMKFAVRISCLSGLMYSILTMLSLLSMFHGKLHFNSTSISTRLFAQFVFINYFCRNAH